MRAYAGCCIPRHTKQRNAVCTEAHATPASQKLAARAPTPHSTHTPKHTAATAVRPSTPNHRTCVAVQSTLTAAYTRVHVTRAGALVKRGRPPLQCTRATTGQPPPLQLIIPQNVACKQQLAEGAPASGPRKQPPARTQLPKTLPNQPKRPFGHPAMRGKGGSDRRLPADGGARGNPPARVPPPCTAPRRPAAHAWDSLA